MKIGVKVGDIMTRDYTSAKPDISVLHAVKLMVKKRVGSLILEDKDVLKGILTEGDIMWALSKKSVKDLKKIRAIEICTKKIITIKPSADIYDAIKLMKKAKFRRLPVTVKKRVIGLLTMKDILRIQPELFDIVRENYSIKEEAEKMKRVKSAETFKEGVCEECSNFDILYNVDGQLMCESCREAM
ncbi:MAG: CBS domain-containing protein [Candidatus Nanoarchaeia archaeon]|nr:CBS domain-containing protein [Candidatus Nanoarchaeia archaeon]MDD5740742.1 CBS domain-containing protein [Candidatus Nanoarchaeia archaeon]